MSSSPGETGDRDSRTGQKRDIDLNERSRIPTPRLTSNARISGRLRVNADRTCQALTRIMPSEFQAPVRAHDRSRSTRPIAERIVIGVAAVLGRNFSAARELAGRARGVRAGDAVCSSRAPRSGESAHASSSSRTDVFEVRISRPHRDRIACAGSSARAHRGLKASRSRRIIFTRHVKGDSRTVLDDITIRRRRLRAKARQRDRLGAKRAPRSTCLGISHSSQSP